MFVLGSLFLSACGGDAPGTGDESGPAAGDLEALLADARSPGAEDRVRATCTSCHVFPTPDILPRGVWPTAIRGMFKIAERRGIPMALSTERVLAWYALNAPPQLPPAAGRSDAGVGPIAWEAQPWWPTGAPEPAAGGPGVTHVRMAGLLGGAGQDVLVSDVATNRVYALRPYAPGADPVVVGAAPNPGRLAVTDLDADGAMDVVVAALGQLVPTSDPVGSVMWFRRTGPETFQPETLVDGLGRVADVQAADLNGNGRTDLVVGVFGWMDNGGLFWMENQGGSGPVPEFEQHMVDPRAGFTEVRAVDMNADGRMDLVAVLAQEFQQVVVYWAGDDGFRSEVVFQAPNPDWGYTGLEVADFTGNGLPDVIVTNGDNLDLTVAKPFHGVGLIENLGSGGFEYRHLTAMYGAHKAVVVNLTDGQLPGLVVGAYLPPTVLPGVPAPHEALIWLERVGPTQLVRRVLEADGADHMTMAVGDATGDGRPDLALGLMDLGVVDPTQAHRGDPLDSFVTLWKNLGVRGTATEPGGAEVIDWLRRPPGSDGPGRD